MYLESTLLGNFIGAVRKGATVRQDFAVNSVVLAVSQECVEARLSAVPTN